MIEEKIKEMQEQIERLKENISGSEVEILEIGKKIAEFKAMEERLRRIHKVRYRENLGNSEKIADLANRYYLRDLLDVIAKIADTNLSFSAEAMPLMNLTIWQGMYLLLGDFGPIEEKVQASTGPEDPQPADEEKTGAGEVSAPVVFTNGRGKIL